MTSYSTTHPLPHDFPHLELITLCDKGVDPTLRRHDHQTLGASVWHATFLLQRIKTMKAAIYLIFKCSIDDQLGLGGRRKAWLNTFYCTSMREYSSQRKYEPRFVPSSEIHHARVPGCRSSCGTRSFAGRLYWETLTDVNEHTFETMAWEARHSTSPYVDCM